MAASMWRMNGLCRSTAGIVLLCALLFSGEVMCQDDATDAPAAAATTPEPAVVSTAGASGAPAGDGQAAAATDSPADDSQPATGVDKSQAGGSSDGTAAPAAAAGNDQTAPAVIKDDSPVVKAVVPDVKCVGKEDIHESSALKVVVDPNNCDETKRIIQENPAPWCSADNCKLEIFQEGDTMLVASNDAKLSTLADVFQSEHLKDKLGVSKTETPSSSGSSVFVGILITGLLAAAAIVVAYFKCQRKPDTKGAKLAEEDIENQGNTLASVAPLNPPPETQEKPSVNGESPEAGKTQTPPPTNGHSTAKTADTEL